MFILLLSWTIHRSTSCAILSPVTYVFFHRNVVRYSYTVSIFCVEARGIGAYRASSSLIVLNLAKTHHRWNLSKICKCGYVYTVKSFHLHSIILLFICLKTLLGLARNVWMVLIFLSYESKNLSNTVLLLQCQLCILTDLFILDCKEIYFMWLCFYIQHTGVQKFMTKDGGSRTKWMEKLKQGIAVYCLYNRLYYGRIKDWIIMAEAIFLLHFSFRLPFSYAITAFLN